MRQIRQRLVRHANLVSVFGDFAGVHHCTGDLDWPHVIEVVVAEVVGELLNLAPCEIRLVLDYVEMNWAGCGNRCLVGNKEEIKAALGCCMFNQTLVNDCARSWVLKRIKVPLSKSSVHAFVNQSVDDLWAVVA